MGLNRKSEYRVFHELVKPHIQSFDYFLDQGLQQATLRLKPIEVSQPSTGINLREKPVVSPPMKEDKERALSLDQRLRPWECRQTGSTYKGQFFCDLCFQWNDKAVMRFNTSFGRLPIMVMSSMCHLRGADCQQLVSLKEEASEMGGYFICNGIERIIRLLLITKRNHVLGIRRNAFKNRGTGYTDIATMIRCVRPDQTSVTIRVYYLQHGSATIGFSFQRQEYLIPVGIILKAIFETQDREIYELLTSVYRKEKEGIRGCVGTQLVRDRAQIILEEVKQHALLTRLQCLEYIGERFRPIIEGMEAQPATLIGEKVIEDFIFVHLDSLFDKFNLLIFMLQKLFALADKTAAPDNPDALQHQEILLPGHLLTMYVKDRLQDWLSKFKMNLLKEIEEKPGEFDLQDMKKVQKVVDKVPTSEVCKRIEYLLNTGNLAARHQVELMQNTGYTIVAERLNFLRYLSHFRSVHRGAFFQTLRTTTVRKLLPESWGFLCPVHTPDGTPCGLLNHLTSYCQITIDLDARGAAKDFMQIRKNIIYALSSLGMVLTTPRMARVGPPDFLSVVLDGRVIGNIPSYKAPHLVRHLRLMKVSDENEIPSDLEVAYVPSTFAGAYPGLFLFTSTSRMIRPVKQMIDTEGGYAIEMIGPLEQAYMEIRCPDGGDGGSSSPDAPATHEEISPIAMLSVVASLTPWSDHNQSPRNMYQCQMAKQTMGFPAQSIEFRSDNKLYRLQTPQTPLARTVSYTKYNMDEFPTGTNAIVAVLSYTGYDMEDAMIINKSSMERGLCHGQIYKTETIDLTTMRQRGDGVVNVFGRAKPLPGRSNVQEARVLDVDGLPYIGQRLEGGDPYCSVVNTMTGRTKLSKVKASETAVVDYVGVMGTGLKEPLQKGSETAIMDFVSAIGTGLKEPSQKVVIRFRQPRNPIIGDKFSSRHGQKGVCSQLWPDIDMPFSAMTGMRPDIIINPHAFPSRMTIGMLLESMAAKGGALEGKFVNATPFQRCISSNSRKSNDLLDGGTAVDDYGQVLRDHGFNYHGTEVMHSGILGTELVCEIFIGVVYYQRLRHMVSDKFQVRSTGAVNPITQQPVKGRAAGGGIRFGEMERDSLLAHGAAYLLHDRMHTCSDYHIASVCASCGSLLSPVAVPHQQQQQRMGITAAVAGAKARKATCLYCKSGKYIERVAMPFAFRYLAAELAAMNVKMVMKVSES